MPPVVGGSGAAAAGIIARKRKKIINAFKEHGATSPETARSLVEVGLSDSPLAHVMSLRHVIVNVGGDRFYLDTERAKAVERTQRVVVLISILAVAAIFVFLWRMGILF